MSLIEIWRNIEGYDGIYQVSNLGRVKSFHRKTPIILKPMFSHKGYLRVELHYDTTCELRSIHRLVMETFNPNDEGLQINHIDGDKTNNRLDNLEWCSGSENVRHAFACGLRTPKYGEEHWNCKLTNEDVKEIKRVYIKGSRTFGSYALAKQYGVDASAIQKIVNGKFRRNVS